MPAAAETTETNTTIPQPQATVSSSTNEIVSLIVGPAGAVIILALMGYATYKAIMELASWGGARIDKFGSWAATKVENWVEGLLEQMSKITSQTEDLIENSTQEGEKNRRAYAEEAEKDRKITSQSFEIIASQLNEIKSCQATTETRLDHHEHKINQILEKVSQ